MPAKKSAAAAVKRTVARVASPDAITLLKTDHKKVRVLLETIDKTENPGRRLKLLSQIEKEIVIHATVEEEIFYPAFKRAAEESEELQMFFEATEEHGLVKIILPKAKNARADSEQFGALVKVLKDLIVHHAKEEEKEMFKAAKGLFSKDELKTLGDQIQRRKRELSREMKASA